MKLAEIKRLQARRAELETELADINRQLKDDRGRVLSISRHKGKMVLCNVCFHLTRQDAKECDWCNAKQEK